MLIKLEYIWVDSEDTLRGKTKIWDFDPHKYPKYNTLRKNGPCPEELPIWGDKSIKSLLIPNRVVVDPKRKQSFLVMCDTSMTDERLDMVIEENVKKFLFGFKQKYVLRKSNSTDVGLSPRNKNGKYCGIGYEKVLGREIMEEHLDACLSAGLKITDINAERWLGQWEYSLMSEGNSVNENDLWLSKYFLIRLCEKHDMFVEFDESVSKEIIVDNKKVEYEN
jgi:glutamine synthetase